MYLTTKTYKGIFYMTWLSDRFHAALASVSSSTAASLEVWHKRLAHINYATVKRIINSSCVTGMNVIASSLNSTCEWPA